ncbi:MAG: transglycosylase family protein [Solirubrobacterales bacterium]
MLAPQIRLIAATFLLTILLALALVAIANASTGEGARYGGHGKNIDKRHKEVYDGLWKRKVSPANKRWARRVAACESGRDADAIGADGLYRGAFQFSISTWRSSPKSPGGDPIAFSYRTQAFVAVRLKGRAGTSPWPNCG